MCTNQALNYCLTTTPFHASFCFVYHQVRQDLLSRLNDAKRSFIKGGVSPRARTRKGYQNKFRRATVVGSRAISSQLPLIDELGDESDEKGIRSAEGKKHLILWVSFK